MIYSKTYTNGARLVLESVKGVRSVSAGIWIAAGSRQERKDESGIAHFIEHMLFKGTKRRSVEDISNEINELGGDINAYTSQEAICLYGKVIDENYPQLIDLLTDLLFNSRFLPLEMKREKRVIEEEIHLTNDTPEELIFDIFIESIYKDNSIGSPVLGRLETLNSFTEKKIRDFIRREFTPDKIVIAASGNLNIKDFEKAIDDILEKINFPEKKTGDDAAVPVPSYQVITRQTQNLDQVHFCIGTDAIARVSDDRYAMGILNMILGGDNGSRIYKEVREKRGMAYSIGSSLTLFSDCGFFAVNGGTQKKFVLDSFEIILREIKKTTKTFVSDDEINIAKKQIKASVLLGLENTKARMNRLGEQKIYFDKIMSYQMFIKKIDAVGKNDVLAVANKYLKGKPITITTIGPLGKKELSGFCGVKI